MDHVLMTDRYELSMLQSFIRDGSVNKKAVFEVFTRKLPKGRRYGVFAGLGRLLPLIENFRFEGEVLTYLRQSGMIDRDTYLYLSDFGFTGTIESYLEGDIFFPNSPLMTVTGTLGECIVLETLILSVLNHDSAIATTAARMVTSAKGRPLIEMGSRRTHEESAVAAARAAYIAGFASTSNMLAGMRYGIPVVGTAAHAFTLAHGSEVEAFKAQVDAHGPGTTLLVDTYDIEQGIRNAVAVAGTGLGGIRIDSGDLAYEAEKARVLLDSLGAFGTKIIVTSDLDEHVLKDLADSPIDGYGVGTKLVAAQPMGMVYKLVAIQDSESLHVKRADGMDLCEYDDEPWPCAHAGEEAPFRPVAKAAKGKQSVGGRKWAYRKFERNGSVSAELFTTDPDDAPRGATPMQRFVMIDGKVTNLPSLDEIRGHHKSAKGELPMGEQKVWSGEEFGPYLAAEHYTGEE